MITQIKKFTQELIELASSEQNITVCPKIVLGLSGGPDSVFLLHVLALLQNERIVKVIASHLDHGWRVDSEKDMAFCRELCKNLNIDFVSSKASELNLSFKFNGSKEEIGRHMRRHFFDYVLHENCANFVILAHHAQDQQETFFMRLLRGTTLSGLRCMDLICGKYIRPLLEISKEQILEYLEQNKIKYLTDITNLSDEYLRNRIRKYVIPALKKCDARFELKFQSSLKNLKQENLFLEALTCENFFQIFTFDLEQGKWLGDLSKFQITPLTLKRRVILHWLIKEKVKFNLSQKYLNEILKFLHSKAGGSHSIGCNWSILKKEKKFFIKN